MSTSVSISVQNCPLCNGTSSTLFDQRIFREILVSNRLCLECGLVYQSPRMSDEELEAFYEQEYRQLYQNSQEPSAKDLATQAGRAQSLLSFFTGAVAADDSVLDVDRPTLNVRHLTVNRHLDIGCSAGLLLQSFQAEYHCKSVGIEPGAAYRTYAQARGLEVHATLQAYSHPDLPQTLNVQRSTFNDKFDLISLAHVLEHLPNPVEYLTMLRQEWLTAGGWLLVEVPNLYGHDCFEIAHLVSFSPHTLEQTLQKAGFRIQARLEHGRPRSELIPLYITALARPASDESIRDVPVRNEGSAITNSVTYQRVIPENGVRRKRKVAIFRRKVVTRLSPRKAWLPLVNHGRVLPKKRLR
jgi:SAM-dependent methyltransferase